MEASYFPIASRRPAGQPGATCKRRRRNRPLIVSGHIVDGRGHGRGWVATRTGHPPSRGMDGGHVQAGKLIKAVALEVAGAESRPWYGKPADHLVRGVR